LALSAQRAAGDAELIEHLQAAPGRFAVVQTGEHSSIAREQGALVYHFVDAFRFFYRGRCLATTTPFLQKSRRLAIPGIRRWAIAKRWKSVGSLRMAERGIGKMWENRRSL
jgi:hypothetical protein